MAYSPHPTRAAAVPLTISSGPREKKLTADQTRPLHADQAFQLLGEVELQAEVESTIQIQDKDTTGFVILDALQLVPLDASPHARNTIVVLYSDHGFFFGEKEHLVKQSLWERATRVAFIISAPGLARDTKCARPVELLSIYPTLVELCSLTQPPPLDGVSIAPLLRDPQVAWERPAITTHGKDNHAVRTASHRYIRYRDGSEELYDHTTDPHEWINLTARPEHTTLKAELAAAFPKLNIVPVGGDEPASKTNQSP
jgi:hypothetical protein